jgi:succinoglycan biosynthesis protein ExoA
VTAVASPTNQWPFVSLIIPCRNEAEFIGRCLESIIATTYPPDRYEVLVVDGMSVDGTRAIVERYARGYAFLRLLDNPKGITPAAFNIGARAAQGEAVLIMGAHATYDPDYVRLCVEALFDSGADNVGGVLRTVPRTDSAFGRGIALALSHPFGVGNSAFRTGADNTMRVDTVFGGCYRRDVFDRIGYWNEDLLYSQDIEFNRRLVRAGGQIMLVPSIVTHYYARSSLCSFIRHTFRNGVWSVLPFRYTSHMPVQWRQLVPGLALVLGIALLLASLVSAVFWSPLIALVAVYVAAALIAAIATAGRERDWRYVVSMPAAFATLHAVYGAGSVWGLGRWLLSTFSRTPSTTSHE